MVMKKFSLIAVLMFALVAFVGCVDHKDRDDRPLLDFISESYTNGPTNYPEIFASSADMQGLQTLIDQYLAEKAFREYQFSAE